MLQHLIVVSMELCRRLLQLVVRIQGLLQLAAALTAHPMQLVAAAQQQILLKMTALKLLRSERIIPMLMGALAAPLC